MTKWIEDLKSLPEFKFAQLGLITTEELMVAAAKTLKAPFPVHNEMVGEILAASFE